MWTPEGRGREGGEGEGGKREGYVHKGLSIIHTTQCKHNETWTEGAIATANFPNRQDDIFPCNSTNTLPPANNSSNMLIAHC